MARVSTTVLPNAGASNGSATRALLCTEDITAPIARTLFFMADDLLPWITNPEQRRPLLSGKTLAAAFYENSTRTRLSFTLAAQYLGMQTVDLSVATSSVQKGETLEDTLLTLAALGVNAVALRHGENTIHTDVALPVLAAKNVLLLNAGAGNHEHPTQALLDAYTLYRTFDGKLSGKTLCMAGDIAHSRVARSNAQLLNALGVKVTIAAPACWHPNTNTDNAFAHAQLTESLAEGLANADAVMALRIQHERHSNTEIDVNVAHYQINHGALEKWAPNCKAVLHPGPMNRDVEISSALADDPNISCIPQQVTHGVAIRMALLLWGFGLDTVPA